MSGALFARCPWRRTRGPMFSHGERETRELLSHQINNALAVKVSRLHYGPFLSLCDVILLCYIDTQTGLTGKYVTYDTDCDAALMTQPSYPVCVCLYIYVHIKSQRSNNNWTEVGTLTWDVFRVVAHGVHEVTHGVQFPPETTKLLKLWVSKKDVLSVCIYPSQTRERG